MKALWRYHNGLLAFQDVPEPQIQKPSDIKIKVMYTTIGIQDLRMYREWDFYAKPGIAGYEMSGIIVDLGESAKREGFYIGQHVSGTIASFCGECVYCQKGEENNCLHLTSNAGTICEYIIWNKNQVVPLPPNMSFSKGCLLEPVAVVYHGSQKIQIQKADHICIFGGDFNGLLMLQFAKQAGATVTIVEPKEYNRNLAKSYGADFIIHPEEETYRTQLMEISDFIGFSSVIITSSHPDWLTDSMNLVARGGTIMIMVYYDQNKEIAMNSTKFFAMNINITSSFLYSKKELAHTLDLLKDLKLDKLIPIAYPMKDALAAFDLEQVYLYPRIGLYMR